MVAISLARRTRSRLQRVLERLRQNTQENVNLTGALRQGSILKRDRYTELIDGDYIESSSHDEFVYSAECWSFSL